MKKYRIPNCMYKTRKIIHLIPENPMKLTIAYENTHIIQTHRNASKKNSCDASSIEMLTICYDIQNEHKQ